MPEVTAEELARVRRWAVLQTPEVTVEQWPGWTTWAPRHIPGWLCERFVDKEFSTVEECWSYVAIALRPVFDSVGTVIREELAELIDRGTWDTQHGGRANRSEIAASIRSLK